MKGRWKNISVRYLPVCITPAPKPDTLRSWVLELKSVHGTFDIRLLQFKLKGMVRKYSLVIKVQETLKISTI